MDGTSAERIPVTVPYHERDAMICRSCGNEERASEGYPCQECGTFLCIICTNRGIEYCKTCAAKRGVTPPDAATS